MGVHYSTLALHLVMWVLPLGAMAAIVLTAYRAGGTQPEYLSAKSIAVLCFFTLTPLTVVIVCGRYVSSWALWSAAVSFSGLLWVYLVVSLMCLWSFVAAWCWG